jgi:DDE superfamily endonuclease
MSDAFAPTQCGLDLIPSLADLFIRGLSQPPGRFEFTFTPKHGSWLNLIEGFFSKFARSILRHIRVTSKHQLKERIMAWYRRCRHPVIHTWSYKLAEAA